MAESSENPEVQEKPAPDPLEHCSFCEKGRSEVAQLIAGPHASICNECVALCNDILVEEQRKDGSDKTGE